MRGNPIIRGQQQCVILTFFFSLNQTTYRNRAAEVPVVFSSEGIVHEKSARMKYNNLRSELLR